MEAWISVLVLCVVAVVLVAIIIGLKARQHIMSTESEVRINKLRQELGSVRQQLPIDLPTGLGNANQLEDDWSRLSALHKRRGDPFSFVAVRVTDAVHHGEPLESRLMRDIASKLFGLTRTEDHSYRLDVDTFGFLLTGAELEGAQIFVERAKRELENSPFGGAGTAVYVETIAGAAEWENSLETLHGLIQAAIKAAVQDQKQTEARRRQLEGLQDAS